MARQKIWYTKTIKIPGMDPSQNSNLMSNRIAWTLKQVLTQASGFAPEGIPASAAWGVYSSSNGGSDLFIGDYWAPSTTGGLWGTADTLLRGNNTQPHAWCILKAPSLMVFDSGFGESSRKDFFLNISLNHEHLNSITFSYDMPTPQSGAYGSPMSGAPQLQSYWGWDASNITPLTPNPLTRGGGVESYMAPLTEWSFDRAALSQENIYLMVSVADDGSFFATLRTTAYWRPYYSWLLMCVKIPFSNLIQNPTSSSGISSNHNIYTYMSSWRYRGAVASQIEDEFSLGNKFAGFGTEDSVSGTSQKAKKLGFSSTARGANSVVTTSALSVVGYSADSEGGAYYTQDLFEADGTSILTHPFLIAETGVVEPVQGTPSFTQNASGRSPITAILPDFYFAPASLKSNIILESGGDNYISIGQLLAPISTGTTPL